jgi:hypothetical protein
MDRLDTTIKNIVNIIGPHINIEKGPVYNSYTISELNHNRVKDLFIVYITERELALQNIIKRQDEELKDWNEAYPDE